MITIIIEVILKKKHPQDFFYLPLNIEFDNKS